MDLATLFIKLTADFLIVPMIIVGGWIGLKLMFDHKKILVVKALATGIVALILAKIFSLFYQGERPFVQQGVEPGAVYLDNPGFPSDHALLAFVIVYIVWASTKNAPLSMTLFICAVLVAVGRVLALVHTPVDVLGGFACATIAALIIYRKDLMSTKVKKLNKPLPDA